MRYGGIDWDLFHLALGAWSLAAIAAMLGLAIVGTLPFHVIVDVMPR